MAKRVTSAELEEMFRLYDELGTYKAVADKLNRDPSTVSKHIRMKGSPPVTVHTMKRLVREKQK